MSSASQLAVTPEPPYYAVIFTSLRTEGDRGYGAMSERMIQLAAGQPGFLGVESARDGVTGLGITVSYWKDEDSIRGWRENAQHRIAQETGKQAWYTDYQLRVARVERAYGGPAGR